MTEGSWIGSDYTLIGMSPGVSKWAVGVYSQLSTTLRYRIGLWELSLSTTFVSLDIER